jgi:Xrn1 helical domain
MFQQILHQSIGTRVCLVGKSPGDFEISVLGGPEFMVVFFLPQTLETVYSTLTEDEVNRNTRGETLLFAGRTHDVTAALNDTFYSSENANKPSELTWLNLPAESIYGMAGLMALDTCCHWLDHPVPAPYPSLPILTINAALSVCYQDPQYPDGYRYLAKRLPRAKSPPRVLVEGRAQMGFDPNRQRTNLNPSAHRMLSGAIRGGGGGRGRDFYDNRNSYSGNHDGRRSYNEEREPRRDDSYRRHSDFAHEVS